VDWLYEKKAGQHQFVSHLDISPTIFAGQEYKSNFLANANDFPFPTASLCPQNFL